jgi:hypothetical protein
MVIICVSRQQGRSESSMTPDEYRRKVMRADELARLGEERSLMGPELIELESLWDELELEDLRRHSGSRHYLKRLAIENSSAFASLLGKVLPTTLAATDESNGGLGTKITFERIIVMPDGQRYIEGVTPKALPAPDGDKAQ